MSNKCLIIWEDSLISLNKLVELISKYQYRDRLTPVRDNKWIISKVRCSSVGNLESFYMFTDNVEVLIIVWIFFWIIKCRKMLFIIWKVAWWFEKINETNSQFNILWACYLAITSIHFQEKWQNVFSLITNWGKSVHSGTTIAKKFAPSYGCIFFD